MKFSTLKSIKLVVIALAASVVAMQTAFGTLVITNMAVGGTNISLDTSSQASGGGSYTTLLPIEIDETSSSDLPGTGNLTLTAPAGFRFDTTAAPAATITELSGNSGVAPTISTSSVTSSTITYALSRNTPIGNRKYRLSFSGVKVQPTTTTAVSGNLAIQVTTEFTGNIPLSTPSSGSPSATSSTVAVSSGQVNVGEQSTITVQAKDQFGNNLTTGGATIVFSKGNGVSDGTLSSVTDNNNGTYSVTFTGTFVGSARSISATVNGAALNSGVSVKVNGLSVQTDSTVYTLKAGEYWYITNTIGADNLVNASVALHKRNGGIPDFVKKKDTVDPSIYFMQTVFPEDAGDYTIYVTNNGAVVQQDLSLVINDWHVEILSEAVINLSVPEGQAVAMMPDYIIGNKPRTHEWYYRASPAAAWSASSISSDAKLRLTTTSASDAGQYKLVVFNQQNVDNAIPAAEAIFNLSFTDGAPRITRQARSVDVVAGNNAALVVVAYGSGVLNYKWYQADNGNWAEVPGATTARLLIPGATETGDYYCEVSNAFGTSTSAVATITVDTTYLAAAGSYAGLLIGTPLTIENAGYITLKSRGDGSFSGRLVLANSTNGFAGNFDNSGQASLVVNGKNLELSTSLTNPGVITGNYDNAPETNVELVLANGSANGTYHVLIPGAEDSSIAPSGTSYAVLTVAGNDVTVAATLADGSSFKQTTVLLSDNSVPLFGSLYGNTGVVIGFVNLTNVASGLVDWLSTAATAYPNPFHLSGESYLTQYTPADPSIAAGTYTITLSGAHLSEPIFVAFSLGAGNVITYLSPLPNRFTLNIEANGRFSGTFFPNQTITTGFKGVLDQVNNRGDGWFLTRPETNPARQSGLVEIAPVPAI